MPDRIFSEPRLAELYDALDPDRSDLDVYAAVADELGADRVLDVGCGTGTFACLLASNGKTVVGVDPAAASLEVARRKPHAERVTWHLGDIASLPSEGVDLVTMTGNVAQVYLDDDEWGDALRAAHRHLRPGGSLVFETRDPGQEAWRAWNPTESRRRADVPGVGLVETWTEVTDVSLPYVTFSTAFAFARDGTVATSESTLVFRRRTEIEASLAAAGFTLDDVRDAPDRPGRELVFVARATPTQSRGAPRTSRG